MGGAFGRVGRGMVGGGARGGRSDGTLAVVLALARADARGGCIDGIDEVLRFSKPSCGSGRVGSGDLFVVVTAMPMSAEALELAVSEGEQ